MKKELIKLHHARSAKDFPELRLEENEFVELAISRSKLGVVLMWGAAAFGYLALFVAILFLEFNAQDVTVALNGFAKSYLYLIILVLFCIIQIRKWIILG